MDSRDERTTCPSPDEPHVAYERPRVERVLTAAELEREVLYAGAPASPGPG